VPRRRRETEFYVDIIAYDRDENPALLVEVKARPSTPEAIRELRASERAVGTRERRPFLMLVDLDQIILYRPVERGRPSEFGRHEIDSLDPIVRLETPEILRHYDPDFGSKSIYKFYLCGLTEAWLRDLAYRWKSESPPGAEVLGEAGLLDRLRDGTTVMEDVARARPALP
jgi:hypothetical protein